MFVLETKSHRGRVTLADDGKGLLINGRAPEKDFVKQCHRNLYWVRDRILHTAGIEPWITTAIVFSNAFVAVRKPIREVHVLNGKFLPTFLQRCPTAKNAQRIWDHRKELAQVFTAPATADP